MSANKFILLAVIITCLSACTNKCCVTPVPRAYFRAEKNGVYWNADSTANTTHNDTISISGTAVNAGSFREQLGFKIKYTGPGGYKLSAKQCFYYNTAGHSAPVRSYQIDTLYNNTLNIFFYNKQFGLVTGSFNVKFLDFTSAQTPPADISFLQGAFYLPLHK